VVNLDASGTREAAQRDPDGFVQQYSAGLLAIDEVQRVPELLLALKNALEIERRPGRFVVTGSADLLTLRGAQESLAGRAQTIALQGLSRGEIIGRTEDFAHYLWNLPTIRTLIDSPEYSRRDYLELILASTYPEIRDAIPRVRNRWLENYLDRVLSKDASDITGIQYPDRLAPLMTVLATENSTEFVAAHYARLLDIPVRSVPAYLKALRDVFLVRELPAWGNNLTTRAVSKPKVIVSDPGLAAFLCGVDADGLERDISSTLTGGLVEGFVASQLSQQQSWSQVGFTLNHYRDNQDREVDIVLENRRREIVGIEVKATTTITGRHFRGLELLRERAGERFIAGAVVYTGPQALPFGDRLWALPIATLWKA
jgi:predicted AAA+ superfamily ATPase